MEKKDTTGLIIGIAAVIPCFYFLCLALGIYAIWRNWKNIKKVESGEMSPDGKTFATIGMITGVLGTGLGILWTIHFLLVGAVMIGTVLFS